MKEAAAPANTICYNAAIAACEDSAVLGVRVSGLRAQGLGFKGLGLRV